MSRCRNAAGRAAVQWVGGGLLAAAISIMAVRLSFGVTAWPGVAAGWGVAMLNAVCTFVIHRASVGPAGQRIPLKGLFFNILRVFTLLGIVAVLFEGLGKKDFYPFLVAMFSSYFVFLVAEIVRLHQSVLKGAATRE